jgi:anion-transporting  ArsA/GET3 family ATPase
VGGSGNRRRTDGADVRLHVVTGKGGTGKTTVAAALALALAAGGRRSLLVEVEGRQGIAQLFDCPPLPYEERKIAVAPGGGDVHALAIDPESALLEYLEMFYNLRRAGAALKKLGAVDFATTIAPGMRDVLLTGKCVEAVKRTGRDGRAAYDAVVVDAPPTGRIVRFLNVNSEVVGLARMGPVKNQAESVMRIIRSPATAVHLVTLLEEMPVQETIDGVGELRSVHLPVGSVIVNMMREPQLPPDALAAAGAGRLDATEVARGLKAAGLDAPDPVVTGLLAEAAEHAQRVALEDSGRERLGALDLPTYELPLLTDAGSDTVDLSGLYRLAGLMREQGAA